MFSPEEQRILQRYFTSTTQPIFALRNLPEVIKGTLFSRYSRTAKDIRRLFLDEFVRSEELQHLFQSDAPVIAPPETVDTEKAENFYERILVGYGDDSVAELGGAHAALEQISILATKSIEEHRIGLSPLEKSTRYVYYDQKVDGEYQYTKDSAIMASPHRELYLEVNNLLFSTYSKIVRDIQPALKEVFPGDENESAYKFSIRAKACDLARGLLPLSTHTNMGVYGNGRAFEYLLITLLNDPLPEVREMAGMLHEGLQQVIPAFVKRATSERGEKYRAYLSRTDAAIAPLRAHTSEYLSAEVGELHVELVDYDQEGIEKIVAGLLYVRSSCDYRQALKKAHALSGEQKEVIIKMALQERQNRHHKPGREFEEAQFAFEVIADWGVYKDLMRHRILTRHHQLFTNDLGYWTPPEVVLTGFGDVYRTAMDRAREAYTIIKKDFPVNAQYVVTHGAYNRFSMRMNLREVMHMAELRSSPQGHPTYRKVAQEMAKRVSEKFLAFAESLFRFVDYNDYELERLDAFRRLEKKATNLGVKGFEE